MLDLLEDAVAAIHREIRDSRKLLGEAQEHVMEDLSSVAQLYLKASDRSALEKRSREMEDIEEEFAKAQECFQEYLHAVKDELSSQASEFSGKLLGLHSQEKKACQHVTDLEEKFREKEESINHARKQLEEYIHRQKEMETEIRESKEELSLAKQDATDKLCKLDGAMDEELGLS